MVKQVVFTAYQRQGVREDLEVANRRVVPDWAAQLPLIRVVEEVVGAVEAVVVEAVVVETVPRDLIKVAQQRVLVVQGCPIVSLVQQLHTEPEVGVQMGVYHQLELLVRPILEMVAVAVAVKAAKVAQVRMVAQELSFSDITYKSNTSQDGRMSLSRAAPGQLRQDRPRIGLRGGAWACGQL